MQYGLQKHEIKEIINYSLNNNPDLKYYIDNDYFDEFMELLLEGICNAIEQNNRQIYRDIEQSPITRHR
ncbi:MAG: hypothetical protein E7523_11700 [Ruminococcaceae bacterium]|nr:hypothetical protein [Oscillospiraceae bacterium]